MVKVFQSQKYLGSIEPSLFFSELANSRVWNQSILGIYLNRDMYSLSMVCEKLSSTN